MSAKRRIAYDSREFWVRFAPYAVPGHLARQIPPAQGGLMQSGWRNAIDRARVAYPDLGWRDRIQGAHPAPPDPWPEPVYEDELEAGEPLAPEPVPLDALKARLRHGGQTLRSLADTYDVSPRRIEEAVETLRAQHLLVEETAEGYTLATTVLPPPDTYRIDTLGKPMVEYPIGVLADTHIGSKYERLDVLIDLFERFAAAGVGDVYVAGNWIDGSGRRFNQHDIYVHGVAEQVANFLAKWPHHPGITSHVLSGDDHEGWFVQDSFTNIGHVLQDEAVRAGRDDIRDLGYMERDVEFTQHGGSAKVRIVHAGGGSAYATSYSTQKIAESYSGGEKPQVLIAGHYHKFNYDYPREIHAIQPGCVQRQTPFMRKRRIPAHVGGCIVRLTQNELGIFTSVTCEWMPYYDQTFYAHGWSAPEHPRKDDA